MSFGVDMVFVLLVGSGEGKPEVRRRKRERELREQREEECVMIDMISSSSTKPHSLPSHEADERPISHSQHQKIWQMEPSQVQKPCTSENS